MRVSNAGYPEKMISEFLNAVLWIIF